MIDFNKFRKACPLDPEFVTILQFEASYHRLGNLAEGLNACSLVLEKNSKQIARQDIQVSLASELREQTLLYLNRYIKAMLWIYGGSKLYTDLPADIIAELQKDFSSEGKQSFDADFIVEGIFGKKFEIIFCETAQLPAAQTESKSMGGHAGGQRLGFDLGGSDKKIAAISNEEVLYTESIIWDPYPQTDLNWHRAEFKQLLKLGAEKLEKVEAVGGSVPGIVMDDKVKVGSLFRGLSGQDRSDSCDVFGQTVAEFFGAVPFSLANDGDVTALAGAMILKKKNLLGIAMGTSEAAGYANPSGSINSWFSELAFVPVDMGPDRSQDEWSKDWGTGVEYFSQQAVIRLAKKVGIHLDENLSKPKKLVEVQKALADGHEGAEKIFQTIGSYLAHTLPWYHRFYQMENVLLLGRVLKGRGGQIIIEVANQLLAECYPELKLNLMTLSDEEILHGQAMAAASLASV